MTTGSNDGVVAPLLDAAAIVVERDISDLVPLEGDLFPEERAALRRAVARRRQEFTAGRVLARQAIARLGCHATAIPAGDDRAPQWPPGIVGSISHGAGWCAVAAGRSVDLRAVGIDVESSQALEPALWRTVCTANDTRWLHTVPAHTRGLMAKLLFSAKESVYKLQYPLTHTFLDFQAVDVRADLDSGRWQATFNRAAGAVFAAGDHVQGRLAVCGRRLATAASLAA